jgi:NOL1/NOP2/fmu family ribosome biogenesis protein
MVNKRLHIRKEWGIVESASTSGNKGYRFYPDKARGEGFFLSCFVKEEGGSEARIRAQRPETVSAAERQAVPDWIATEGYSFFKSKEGIYALPSSIADDVATVSSVLNVIYRGVNMGQVMKGRLVPDHALALSGLLADGHPSVQVEYDLAIRYLQRNEMKVDALQTGWQTVRFKGHDLGWINVLPNRINNYYPKELRILKQQNDSGIENL